MIEGEMMMIIATKPEQHSNGRQRMREARQRSGWSAEYEPTRVLDEGVQMFRCEYMDSTESAIDCGEHRIEYMMYMESETGGKARPSMAEL